jgi:dephospho-CoA kinase
MLVGITGCFGSGKSSVTDCFKDLGASIVDSDAVVAEIYAHDDDFLNKLRDKFGMGVFNAMGEVDRKPLETGYFPILMS